MIKTKTFKISALLLAALLRFSSANSQCSVSIQSSGDLENNPGGVSLWTVGAQGNTWTNTTTGQTFSGSTIWASTPGVYVVNATDYNPSTGFTCQASFVLGGKNGIQFNGSNQGVTIPANNKMKLGSGDFTFDFIIKPTTNVGTHPSNAEMFFSNANQDVAQGFASFQMNRGTCTTCPDNLSFNSGSAYAYASANLRDGKCHHLAVTKQGNIATMYVDGIQVYRDIIQYRTNSTGNNLSPWHLGASNTLYQQYNSFSNVFNGIMKEFRVWNKALTQTQVQSYMNKSLLPANESGLVAYYPMNESTGQTVNDKALNPVAGFLGISPANNTLDPTRAASNCAEFTVPALTFNGTTQGAIIPANTKLALGKNNFTIEFTLKASTALNTDPRRAEEIFANSNSPTSDFAYMYMNRTNCSTCPDYFTFNSGHGQISFTYNVKDGKCHHFAITKSANVNYVYVDGVLVASQPVSSFSTGNVGNTTAPWTIGSSNMMYQDYTSFSNVLDGTLKEFRIWNFARTQTQIKSTINKTLVGNETGLIAYYPLNEGTGEVINDQAAAPVNGFLGNSATTATLNPVWTSGNCATIGNTLRQDNTSADLDVATDATVATESIIAFPNPFSEELSFTVNLGTEGAYKAELVNSLGEVVFSKENMVQGMHYNVNEELSAGTYLLKISNGSEVKIKKVVKN